AGLARSGIESSRCRRRSRDGGRRSDAGSHRPVFAVDASAAHTGTDLHAHGTPPCADGRDALWIAGHDRLVATRGVCDENIYAGTRDVRIPNPEPRIPSNGRSPSFPPSGPHPCPREAREALERLDHAARLERGSHRLVRRPMAYIGIVVGNPGLGVRGPGPENGGPPNPGSRIPNPGSMG